ncbi:MAG: hypothetical protein U1B80_08340, partial [Anaerolineaceae bacterium]|nr:hypothetical protein [Anaerolineaceae bacterium]
MISSIIAGFNAVANRIYLILFPVIFDLLVWMGPRLRIKGLLQPIIDESNAVIAAFSSKEMVEIGRATQQLWQLILERFNLFTVLRTYPIGIASLLASQSPAASPLGEPSAMEIASLPQMVMVWFFFILIGILAGSLYFNEIARAAETPRRSFSMREVVWQYGQMLL